MRSKSEAIAGIALIMLASIMAGTTAVGATSEGSLSTDDCPICPDSGMELYSRLCARALVCGYRNSVDINNCGDIAIWPYDNARDAQKRFEDMRTYEKELKDYEILRETNDEIVVINRDSDYHYSVSGCFLRVCSEKSYITEVRVNTAIKDKNTTIKWFEELAGCAKSLIDKKCGEKKEEIEEIILKASKEEFIPKEKVLKNSENSKTIRISGTVKPSLVGQTPLKGAKVEIIAGANPTHTYTSDEGFYEITAEVPDGKGEREVSNFDFTLEPEYFIITVTVEPDELPADGLSTAEIKARVTDSEGYPEEGLEIKFKADCPDGEGTIRVTQGTTDSNGIAKATYTSFKPNGCKHSFGRLFEVTITATEPVHGVEGESILYVTQNELFVWNNAYIPADPNCEFPSELHIILRDIHSNPIADAPIKVKLEGENAKDGTVVPVADSTAVNSEITVYTDGMGCAIAYYKWTGIHYLKNEVVKRVKIIDEKTNACIPEKKIHIGMDLAITGMEPVSFNGGAPGQNAFFRIYITDLMHPDLDLDEFNICSPISAGELPRLNLRLIMKQYFPDFTWDFNEIVTWDKDDQGRTYVKRLESPLTPYVVPLSEGTTWWEVFVDPADCNYKTIIDCYSSNNNIPLYLTTGSSGSNWELFNIWLTNGVLTPHNYAGVVVKCFVRFVPYVSTGVSVIDICNSAYKQDFRDLGRRSLVTHFKDKGIGINEDYPGKGLKITVGLIDKFIRCIQDFKRVSDEGGRILPPWLSSCSCYGFDEIAPLQHENSFEELNALMDKVVHGMISAIPDDIPERRGVIVFNQNIDSVSLTDSGDIVVDNPEMMSSEGDAVVYLVPADETYSLEISTDSSFEIAIYEAGGDEFNRNTYRHEVETAEYLKANMCISNSSDYSLNIDLGGDGSIDEVVNPQETILDIEKPTLRNLQPPDGATVSTSTPTITADYADNSGGCGIDIATAAIAVDDVDCTGDAMVTALGIRYTPDCLVGGQHNATVGVSDNDGNYASVEWSFESITIEIGRISIEAETINTVELDTVKLTVTGVADDPIRVESSPLSDKVLFKEGIDDTPTGANYHVNWFTDTIDADGIRRYAVEFNDMGIYTIKVTVTGGDRKGDSATVDITVLEKEMPLDLPVPIPSELEIAELFTSKSVYPKGEKVDVHYHITNTGTVDVGDYHVEYDIIDVKGKTVYENVGGAHSISAGDENKWHSEKWEIPSNAEYGPYTVKARLKWSSRTDTETTDFFVTLATKTEDPRAELEIAELYTSKSAYLKGENVKVCYHIKNVGIVDVDEYHVVYEISGVDGEKICWFILSPHRIAVGEKQKWCPTGELAEWKIPSNAEYGTHTVEATLIWGSKTVEKKTAFLVKSN